MGTAWERGYVWSIKYTALIVGTTAEKGYQCRCLYHYSQLVYSLATAKEVHTSGGNCEIYLPNKRDQEHIVAKSG